MSTLALANGIVIDKETGRAIGPSPSADKVKKHVEREARAPIKGRDRVNSAVRIGVAELPAEPRALTTIGVVWIYYTLGLNDYDIAEVTGLTVAQVESIKGLSMFDTLQETMLSNLSKLGEEDMHARIARLAPRAMDELEDILDDGEVEAAVKVRVADSLLDRAGFAPKQITEHRHKHEGGLIIRYVEEKTIDAEKMPPVQIDRNGATDA